ncbi:anthranilate synthase family protein [Kibdelosporangium phytohabitans]|uniref:anthranilate synthase n=1 Tax=Kibdelosporangium phytohabitans TaxID=860235 RepID=A0A0N9I3H0_9PSEU|nr:anthranilate synthase family protein [Kibdelosporangium phytohabitans]ALG09310.1 anthranilate synthase [Kibdelosporangium phytohabitans]MBE1469434.1 phenazine biosynthesis protein phzE [Kibdelosporangium phytohabitans]
MTARDLLGEILAPDPPPFALVHRPDAGPLALEVFVGECAEIATLADIPGPGHPHLPGESVQDTLVLVPYRQIAERGFACVDDGTPLLAMSLTAQQSVPLTSALTRLPDEPIRLDGEWFDVSDEDYAETVRTVVADEIGCGTGANFVIRRTFVTDIAGYRPSAALSFFRNLLRRESGAYWTFIVYTGERTLVGATPERHVSLRAGTAVMNPISGTYRYPQTGPSLSGVLDFLADGKETDELYMVLDEELKMMARICDDGGRVVGPYLKEMARLAHTEYLIEGTSSRDPRELLRETMFAPTVTGSPLESACRVIARYEPGGRGYYSGVIALLGRDATGAPSLDSSILIRTADIDQAGRTRIGVGATLVRHSDPAAEAAETKAKAAGLLAALRSHAPTRFGTHPEVRGALARRNTGISRFWLAGHSERARAGYALAGREVLVVDMEDTFTTMIGHQLRSLGLTATVRRFDEPFDFDGHDLVVMGPGPGDPRDDADPRIGTVWSTLRALLARRTPFLAVCLSHQVLSLQLGMPVRRKPRPSQGEQRRIDLFGCPEQVGFYNTFTAVSAEDKVRVPETGMVEVSRDPATGEVFALRGPYFASLQFHAESVLTADGVGIVARLLTDLLGTVPERLG